MNLLLLFFDQEIVNHFEKRLLAHHHPPNYCNLGNTLLLKGWPLDYCIQFDPNG